MEQLTEVPTQFVVGETVEWLQSFTDYPAGTWTVTTSFVNASHKFTVVSSANGTDHLSAINKATSEALHAGQYAWQSKISDGTSVHIITSGTCLVVASFSAATTHDGRTHARVVLDALEAVIQGRATQDHLSMSVGGRSVSKMSLAELFAARDQYRREVADEKRAEDIEAGRTGRGKIRTRFLAS